MNPEQYKLLIDAFEDYLWRMMEKRFKNEQDEIEQKSEALQKELDKRGITVKFQ